MISFLNKGTNYAKAHLSVSVHGTRLVERRALCLDNLAGVTRTVLRHVQDGTT